MPVKIIKETTNNHLGVINEDDLVKMKNDFITETDLKPKASRTEAKKSRYCYLYKEQIDDLFTLSDGATILKINFALQLFNTKECDPLDDYSDSLTVVIEACDDNEDRTVHANLGDYVLIPAYANKTTVNVTPKENGGNPCCPSQK